MDEKQERKLRSAAVQERRMAALAADAVARAEAKLARFREMWESERDAMEQGLVGAVEEAQAQAVDAELRAVAAERAAAEAGLAPGAGQGHVVAAVASPAAGKGGV